MSTTFVSRDSDQYAPSSLAMCCPECECELTFHQPDPELADRLLATCDECKSWFLANSERDLLMALPEFPDYAIPRQSTA
jgi:hypothetical protein